MRLKETFLKKVRFVRGKAVNFQIDQVRLPNRKKAIREYLDHPGAVAVLPVLKDGRILLVGQFRYPVNRVTWEIPAGKLDGGETPRRCVDRELKEETGYTAKTIKPLLSFWPTPAFSNEVIHIYQATNLVPGHQNLDEDEFLKARPWRKRDIFKAIQTGRIRDSKTVIAFLSYLSSFRGGQKR